MNYEDYDQDEYYIRKEKKNKELIEAFAWATALVIVGLFVYGMYRLVSYVYDFLSQAGFF
jgi:hypothetical protein